MIFLFCLLLQKELAQSITLEQGKTTVDAEGDVLRGLRKLIYANPIRAQLSINNSIFVFVFRLASEVVEHCCSITSLQLGETMPSIAKDMDTMSFRAPLGVCAGITPFNFPAMIPLWVRGNSFPSACVEFCAASLN